MTERKSVPIRFSSITKTYQDVTALDAVDLEVGSGEFITLLGPSGSGKTTLLMVLAGFTRPTSGTVRIDGEDITRQPPHKRDLGMVFQSYALFPHMTVGANVAYPLKVRKIARAEIEDRVRVALDLVKLAHVADRMPDALSGGQRQRVALARAIVFEPRILLMDEPLSALDKKLREQMQIEIRHLHERLGITTVYVTHDQREALTMSDRIAVINDGRIVQVDTPEQVYNRPRSLFVADFIGESTVLPLRRRNGALMFGDQAVKAEHPPPPGGDAYLIVRPEKLEFVTGDADPDLNLFSGTLKEKIFQGEALLIRISLVDGTIVTSRRATRREEIESVPDIGAPVTLGLRASDAIVVPRESA
jgi:putative spermidine/putrescine transport system ATP-binding protein